MELVFLILLFVLMIGTLSSGFPVAFSLPGAAILTVGIAALCGYLFANDSSAYFAHGEPLQWLSAGVTNFRGIYWDVERDTLIAIPLFVFMGIMLQRSKIAEDLLITMARLFGSLAGGLGISVVIVGALLAATTGIVGATVVAMGLISLPVMIRHGYSNTLSTGIIAASGTLGQIIPPSIVLIILADQLASAADQASAARKALFREVNNGQLMPSEFDLVSTSAGDMFMGALMPGLVLVGFYILFILVLAVCYPKLAPAVPRQGNLDWQFIKHILLVMVPPLALIMLVLGSIIYGIATVNQAGAIGAVGVLIMSGGRLYKDQPRAYWPAILALVAIAVLSVITLWAPINIKNVQSPSDVLAVVLAVAATTAFLVALLWSIWRAMRFENTLSAVMIETCKTTSLVFIILLGAAMLTAAFRGFGGEDLVRQGLTSLPGGFWMQFAIVMAIIFLLGFFLDFIEIAVVVVPIVAPILLADPSANVTAVWLGVMIGLNIQTSFLTPPFGFALFYLRGVAQASVKTIQMYKGVIAFIAIQLLVLVLVSFYPSLVNYLPNRLALTADTAPPPLNPRLQYCLEKQLFAYYESAKGKDTLQAAIDSAAMLDLSPLPKPFADAAASAISQASNTFALVDEVNRLEALTQRESIAYRPLHQEVRSIEKRLRKIDKQLQQYRTQRKRIIGYTIDAEYESILLQQKIDKLDFKRSSLVALIPAAWPQRFQQFDAWQKQATKARAAYRKNADNAYTPIAELIAIIAASERLHDLTAGLQQLKRSVTTNAPLESAASILEFSKQLKGIADVRVLRKQLSKARRAVKSKKPNQALAIDHLEQATLWLHQELSWRQHAKTKLLPQLKRYEAAIRNTIGLRQQPRIPRATALKLTGCTAERRDISLFF